MTAGAGTAGLLFRRQFILGPRPSGLLLDWKGWSVASRFTLESHPDLPVVQARDARAELTLAGTILDPDHPSRSDADVLIDLLPAAGDERGLLEELRRMGGRWILVVAGDRPPTLFHDACGLRQVVFATEPDGVWCASQPGLLARELSLAPDPAAAAFLSSLYVRSYPEFWWPGTSTPFAAVSQLLPNHALELTTGRVRRYWPTSPRRRVSLTDGTERAARLLAGIVAAAAGRGGLAIGLTAGVDSRAVLAAARPFAGDVFVYTMTGPVPGMVDRDAAVAERLAARVGLAHHRISCPSVMDPALAGLYRASTSTPHEAWEATVSGLFRAYPADRVALTGNCSEISRRGFRRIRPVDVAGLARLENMVASPFARDRIGAWLREAELVPNALDYLLVDLYYWENRMGRWLASTHQEFDLVHETLAPFNCRAIAEALLGLDIADRDPPASRAHKRIVELLWPDLLAEPFNPMSRRGSARTRLKVNVNRALRATRTYDAAKTIQLRLRNRRGS